MGGFLTERSPSETLPERNAPSIGLPLSVERYYSNNRKGFREFGRFFMAGRAQAPPSAAAAPREFILAGKSSSTVVALAGGEPAGQK